MFKGTSQGRPIRNLRLLLPFVVGAVVGAFLRRLHRSEQRPGSGLPIGLDAEPSHAGRRAERHRAEIRLDGMAHASAPAATAAAAALRSSRPWSARAAGASAVAVASAVAPAPDDEASGPRTRGPYYGDLEGDGEFLRMVSAVSRAGEIVLLHGDHRRARMLINLVAGLNAHGIEHILLLAFAAPLCATLRRRGRVGCATSSYLTTADGLSRRAEAPRGVETRAQTAN